MDYNNVMKKLKILADSAKYDISCSSSGSNRANNGGLGNAHAPGICHSFTADGRCISLFKVLLSNKCKYDCAYCVNRVSNDVERVSFTPEELINLTIAYYRRNYIEGLFLSSGIENNPNDTMRKFLIITKTLREKHKFNAYIHVKGIPGSDPELMNQVAYYADRMSINIELPSQKSLKLLAPQKRKEGIVTPMKFLSKNIKEHKYNRSHFYNAPSYLPAGQTTQMVIGASPDSDKRILTLSEGLYQKMNLKRVYYSGYSPVNEDSRLPAIPSPPLLREHRLYQADWLLRFYNFEAKEILKDSQPNLALDIDPKCNWALQNLDLFPIDVNQADFLMLLRVPGIGVTGAKRIIAARRHTVLNEAALKKIGIVLKRARHFITYSGKYDGIGLSNDRKLRSCLTSDNIMKLMDRDTNQQLSMFSTHPELFAPDLSTSLTGLI